MSGFLDCCHKLIPRASAPPPSILFSSIRGLVSQIFNEGTESRKLDPTKEWNHVMDACGEKNQGIEIYEIISDFF